MLDLYSTFARPWLPPMRPLSPALVCLERRTEPQVCATRLHSDHQPNLSRRDAAARRGEPFLSGLPLSLSRDAWGSFPTFLSDGPKETASTFSGGPGRTRELVQNYKTNPISRLLSVLRLTTRSGEGIWALCAVCIRTGDGGWFP